MREREREREKEVYVALFDNNVLLEIIGVSDEYFLIVHYKILEKMLNN